MKKRKLFPMQRTFLASARGNQSYGQTRTYAEQAKLLAKPGAIRAVGRANGGNRIAIIIPCHRVIGADGSLTGYGGGIWRKKFLLQLEAKYSNNYSLFS